MHVLTDSVKDDDRCVNRITNDCQHAGNKGITYRNSGDRIECKNNQNVMEKCKDRTARKTDILETEPDVYQHAECCNKNCNDRISSHLRTYSSRNTFCCDQAVIYIEVLNQSLIQFLTFFL